MTRLPVRTICAEYQPLKCSRPYRLIIVRKNISVQKGERVLFDEIRYFFYINAI